jgi:hypothetical protein
VTLQKEDKSDTVYQYTEENIANEPEYFYSTFAWRAVVYRRPFWSKEQIVAAGLEAEQVVCLS